MGWLVHWLVLWWLVPMGLVPTDSRCRVNSPPWFRWQELRAEAFRTGARNGDWMMALKLHWDSKLIRTYPNQKLDWNWHIWHCFDIPSTLTTYYKDLQGGLVYSWTIHLLVKVWTSAGPAWVNRPVSALAFAGGAPMTARHMDSLIRLAEANARIELRHHVTWLAHGRRDVLHGKKP